MDTKIRVLKSTVFPTATYGCEAWTINKTDGKLITAFEIKCYRKILTIPWPDRVTNEKVLEKVKMNSTTLALLHEIKKLRVGYFGHIKRHESLKKHILEAKVASRRGRGRPKRQWEQDKKNGGRSCGVSQKKKKSEKQRPTRDQLTGWLMVHRTFRKKKRKQKVNTKE